LVEVPDRGGWREVFCVMVYVVVVCRGGEEDLGGGELGAGNLEFGRSKKRHGEEMSQH